MKSAQEDKQERKARFLALFDGLGGGRGDRQRLIASAAEVQIQTVRRWCMNASRSDRAPCRLALDAIEKLKGN